LPPFSRALGIRSPPWYYAPVMTTITIPVTILLPLLLGIAVLLRQKNP
jgi:hypothetical protein